MCFCKKLHLPLCDKQEIAMCPSLRIDLIEIFNVLQTDLVTSRLGRNCTWKLWKWTWKYLSVIFSIWTKHKTQKQKIPTCTLMQSYICWLQGKLFDVVDWEITAEVQYLLGQRKPVCESQYLRCSFLDFYGRVVSKGLIRCLYREV